jgi:uncharacterized protein YcbX
MLLTAIHIYPVKSLAGISLTESVVESRGLRYDRRWMLVTPEGKFLTQREYPAMALIGTAIEPPFLVLFDRSNPNDRIGVPLEITAAGLSGLEVEVWDDRCGAVLVSTDADLWLSSKLNAPVQLVGMPDTTSRAADRRYAPEGQMVSFADGYPFLIIGEASLADLNSRLEIPVPMNRFRPNLVFSGGTPFCEDGWRDFTIGDQPFCAVKPCARCIMTTIDQQTSTKNAEPLRTLASYRKQENKVLFGQNVIWMGKENEATIKVSDEL